MAEERLHKVLAHAGVASRRTSEEMIRAGRVAVDGVVVTEMGTRVDPEAARITVDGRPLARERRHVYLALNKPRGYVTTAGADPYNRPTVLELVRRPERVYPVGRLDFDTEGLLLLTNDGELAHRLMHPRYYVQKEYIAKVRGIPDEAALRRLRQGVPTRFQPEPSPPHRVEIIRPLEGEEAALVRVVIHEGAKRQVREMLAEVGYPVLSLRRTRVGPVFLGELRRGELRELTPYEVAELRRMVNLPADEVAPPADRPRPERPSRGAAPGPLRRPEERPLPGRAGARPAARPAPWSEPPPARGSEGEPRPRPRWWQSEMDEHPPQVRTWHAEDARPPRPSRPAAGERPPRRADGPGRPAARAPFERDHERPPGRPPARALRPAAPERRPARPWGGPENRPDWGGRPAARRDDGGPERRPWRAARAAPERQPGRERGAELGRRSLPPQGRGGPVRGAPPGRGPAGARPPRRDWEEERRVAPPPWREHGPAERRDARAPHGQFDGPPRPRPERGGPPPWRREHEERPAPAAEHRPRPPVPGPSGRRPPLGRPGSRPAGPPPRGPRRGPAGRPPAPRPGGRRPQGGRRP